MILWHAEHFMTFRKTCRTKTIISGHFFFRKIDSNGDHRCTLKTLNLLLPRWSLNRLVEFGSGPYIYIDEKHQKMYEPDQTSPNRNSLSRWTSPLFIFWSSVLHNYPILLGFFLLAFCRWKITRMFCFMIGVEKFWSETETNLWINNKKRVDFCFAKILS